MTSSLRLFNTKSLKKELFKPNDPNNVKLYTCGPTVYNYAHIGNLRTYVFEDLLKRVLLYFGYGVEHVMNLTDVDDKTIRGAIADNKKLDDYTAVFKKAFFEDLTTLNILPANHYPAATDHIPEMIQMIEQLLQNKIAYIGADGSVYFSIRQFPNYGSLSHLDLSELKSGASNRVEVDEYDKESATDFVLWKSYDVNRDGQIFWESPFGKGRPGWHLECSAMAMKYLGDTLDLHMGGVDNIFPHHENEIAQSEACSKKHFCPFWVHVEHLIVEGKKMSKSLGNFHTLRDLLDKGYSGKQVRYLLLQTHYKTQLNFTFDGLRGSQSSLERLQNFIDRLLSAESVKKSDFGDLIKKYEQKFNDSLLEDINISSALATLFDCLREFNPLLDKDQVDKEDREKLIELFKRFDQILGLFTFNEKNIEMTQDLDQALQDREKAREDKDWTEADRLRDYILSKGYQIEDTPKGPQLKKS
ncbi:MAG: Cysteine--tRNA ligase [Chlamydiae bacterium]|nr:Cysteine--tRNA ligase [Chlamydiota bacterium]